MHFIKNDFKFWRHLINTWSVFFFLFVIFDFISNNAYRDFLDVVSIIYISILAIYSSNKEFERWYDKHESQHPGEIFVIIWSVLIFVLFSLSCIFDNGYKMPTSVVSAYIAVLTILAVTKKSKEMYLLRRASLRRKR